MREVRITGRMPVSLFPLEQLCNLDPQWTDGRSGLLSGLWFIWLPLGLTLGSLLDLVRSLPPRGPCLSSLATREHTDFATAIGTDLTRFLDNSRRACVQTNVPTVARSIVVKPPLGPEPPFA